MGNCCTNDKWIEATELQTREYGDGDVLLGYDSLGNPTNFNELPKVDLTPYATTEYVDNQVETLNTEITNVNNELYIHQNSINSLVANKVNKLGDTMNGDLILNRDPSQDLQASTKRYVDTQVTNSKDYTDTQISNLESQALTFKGFISDTQPTVDIREGNLWYDGTTENINFPWPVAVYTNGAWEPQEVMQYTPSAMDLWNRLSDNAGLYYLGQVWNQLDFESSAFNPNQFQVVGGIVGIKPQGITNEEISATANISIDKIDGLGSVLASKANSSALTTLVDTTLPSTYVAKQSSTVGSIYVTLNGVDSLLKYSSISTPNTILYVRPTGYFDVKSNATGSNPVNYRQASQMIADAVANIPISNSSTMATNISKGSAMKPVASIPVIGGLTLNIYIEWNTGGISLAIKVSGATGQSGYCPMNIGYCFYHTSSSYVFKGNTFINPAINATSPLAALLLTGVVYTGIVNGYFMIYLNNEPMVVKVDVSAISNSSIATVLTTYTNNVV